MPRKGGGIAWASPFRSRKKKSEPEPVQSNWATGPPKQLREKTSSFSGSSHSQAFKEKQHADDDALQWSTVVRDSNVRDVNAGLGRPTSLRGVSGEMRKTLDQQQHRHRVLKGDPAYFDEDDGKTSGGMMRSSSAGAPSSTGRSRKSMRKSTAHATSMFRGGHGGSGVRRILGEQAEEEEEKEEHMQRSEAHANAFAPDTDSEKEMESEKYMESEKDMESELGFSLGFSMEDGEAGRFGDDQDDDDVDSVYAAAAAAAVAASGAVTTGMESEDVRGGMMVRTTLVGHEEDGLTRSEVDSSVMGTESVVRSDGDVDSLVGHHLLVGHDVDFDDDIYGAGGSVVAVDDGIRERRHHGIDGSSVEDDASLVEGSVEAPQQLRQQRQQLEHQHQQQHQRQQQRLSRDARDGGQKPVSYGESGIKNEAVKNDAAVVSKSQMKVKNSYNNVVESNDCYDGYMAGKSDINSNNPRHHHLEHRRKNDDVCRDAHRDLRQHDQEVQEHRYPVREGPPRSPRMLSVSSVSAAIAAIDGGTLSKPRASSTSRAVSSTTPTSATLISTTATATGERASSSSRASTKGDSSYLGEQSRHSFSVDTEKDNANVPMNSAGNPNAGGAQQRRDAGGSSGGGKPVIGSGSSWDFDVGVTARGKERIGDGGGDGVNRERRAESMRLGREGKDGGFGSAAEILWERIRVLEQRLGSENGTESEERAAKLEKENASLNEKLSSLQSELQQQAKVADVEKENAVLTKRLVALQSEAVEARAKEIAKTRALEDRVKDTQKKLDERSKELGKENASLKEKANEMQKKLEEERSKELEKENASLKERMNDMQKNLDEERSKELDKENASLKESMSALQAEVDTRKSETQGKDAENASLTKRLAKLEQENEARDDLEEQNASLTQRVTTLTKQLEKADGAPKREEENNALNGRVMVLQNDLEIKTKASADEVAMLNRRISDLRKSHSENMAAAADEFASLNERVNGRDKEFRKLAAAHAAELHAKDEDIIQLQQSLAAASAGVGSGVDEDSDGKLSSDAYEKRLREKDDEISRLEARLLLLHHKSINNIKDDADCGEALSDPMRKNSASSNSSSSSSRKDDGGVTDVEGGSTWSASTSVFSSSSGVSPPSSSFSPMDPPSSSSGRVVPDAARFYGGDSAGARGVGGGEVGEGTGSTGGHRGGVKITTTKRRYRKGNKDVNAGKDPEDAHRGCLVVTCKSTPSTNTSSARERDSSSSGANSKEKEASSSSASAAAVAARLAEAQGVDINPSYGYGHGYGYGHSMGKNGNPALGFGGAQVQQTAAFWDVLSRTLSTAAHSGASSGSSSAEESAVENIPVGENSASNSGENVSFRESLTDNAEGSASMREDSRAEGKVSVREISVSCVESEPSATTTKKNRVGLEVFAGTSTLLCGWGERDRGDSHEDCSNKKVPASSTKSSSGAADDVSVLKANKPCCCNASASTAAVEAKLREVERVAREREEMAQQAMEAAVRAQENAREAEEDALNALDAAEEKMAQAERITTTALWQAEGDFSAAEERIREREETVRKTEEAARVMEAKAREQRELCMELMASAKENTARTEKELAAVRLETAQATATARAARLQSHPQAGPSMEPQQVQQQQPSPSPALVPPSPKHVRRGNEEEGIMEGGDGTISIPATKATAAAVAKYVATMNAAADSASDVPSAN